MEKIFSFTSPKGYKFWDYLFVNYYWILTVGGLFWLVTGGAWLDTTFIPILIYILAFSTGSKIKSVCIFDVLWIICLLWMVLTWVWNSYPHQEMMIIRCLSEQISYMFAYWIVRKNTKLNTTAIIETSYLPLLITCVVGIILFYTEPSWYASRTREYVTDFEEFEFKRLRSIWMDGYIISYFSTIVIIYEIFLIAKGIKNNAKSHYIILGICSITVFLCMLRTGMAAIFACLILAIYYAIKYTRFSNIKNLVLIAVISLCIVAYSFVKMEGEQKLYYAEKLLSISGNSSNLATERMFLNKQVEYDFFGDGAGRHNMYADKYPPNFSMRDGEYNKQITELGYFGAAIMGFIILLALLKSFRYYKYLSFEFAILIMLLISMIGANPLSTGDKHSLFYWLIIGQIANFSLKKENGKRKIIYTNSNL